MGEEGRRRNPPWPTGRVREGEDQALRQQAVDRSRRRRRGGWRALTEPHRRRFRRRPAAAGRRSPRSRPRRGRLEDRLAARPRWPTRSAARRPRLRERQRRGLPRGQAPSRAPAATRPGVRYRHLRDDYLAMQRDTIKNGEAIATGEIIPPNDAGKLVSSAGTTSNRCRRSCRQARPQGDMPAHAGHSELDGRGPAAAPCRRSSTTWSRRRPRVDTSTATGVRVARGPVHPRGPDGRAGTGSAPARVGQAEALAAARRGRLRVEDTEVPPTRDDGHPVHAHARASRYANPKNPAARGRARGDRGVLRAEMQPVDRTWLRRQGPWSGSTASRSTSRDRFE